MTQRRSRPQPTIDTPHNRLVRQARALERDRALRDREGLYLAWGIHLAQEALDSRADLGRALLGPQIDRSAEGRDIARRLREVGVSISRVSTRILESIAAGSGDQGVLLLVGHPKERGPEFILAQRPTLLLVAHGVQDPGNLGSILRSARALGAGAVLALEECADPFGSRAVRAAMGAQFTLPVACATTAPALVALRRAGLALVASDAGATALPTSVDLRAPTAICVGNEGAGLPGAILREAAARVRIPMAAGVDSLNVHAAAVALLYEAARQRGFAGLTPGSGRGREGGGSPRPADPSPEEA